MTLSEYIDAGAKKAGSVAELGRLLGLTREATTAAKSERRQLPIDACIKLADYIDADRIAVISANELATEKKEEKRAFWSHLLAIPTNSYGLKQRFTECRSLFIGLKNIVCLELQPHQANAQASSGRNAQSF